MPRTIERSAALVAAIVTERTLEIQAHEAWQSVRMLTRQLQAAKAKRRWWVDHIDSDGKPKTKGKQNEKRSNVAG